MPQKYIFRYLWVISILVIAALSCSLLSNFVEKSANNVIDTQVGSFSTDIGSISTDILPMVTDLGSIVTDVNVNEVIDTISTQISDVPNTGEKPEGIPVMDPNTDLITNKTHVEFTTTKTVKEATDYYAAQMPANGWTKVEAASKVEADVTTLVYTQANRKAVIAIEEDFIFGGTSVTIDVTGG